MRFFPSIIQGIPLFSLSYVSSGDVTAHILNPSLNSADLRHISVFIGVDLILWRFLHLLEYPTHLY